MSNDHATRATESAFQSGVENHDVPDQSAVAADDTAQRGPRGIDDAIVNQQRANGYNAIQTILQEKNAVVPVIAMAGRYPLTALMEAFSTTYTDFTEMLGSNPDPAILQEEKQVYFWVAQVKNHCTDYETLSRHKQNQTQYQWLKSLLDRLYENEWATSLISDIEQAIAHNTPRAELESNRHRVLAQVFQTHQEGAFPFAALCRYILQGKIAEMYLAGAPAAERIRWIVEIENQVMPFMTFLTRYAGTEEMISRLGAGYAAFKALLSEADVPEQDLADYFIRAHAEARVDINSDHPSPDEADYRWLKKVLCNIPENVAVNGFHSMVPMLEHKGAQALETKQDRFDEFMDAYLPISTGINAFLRYAIRRICLNKLKATHDAPSISSSTAPSITATAPTTPTVRATPANPETELTAEYGIVVPLESESVLLWGDKPAPASLEDLHALLLRQYNAGRAAAAGASDALSQARAAYTFMTDQAGAYYRRKYDEPSAWRPVQRATKYKDYITLLWNQYETGRAAMRAIAAGLAAATQGKSLFKAEEACRTLVFEQLSPGLDLVLRSAITDVILKGVSPLFSLYLEFEERDPILETTAYGSDEHGLMLRGQAHGESRGQTLKPGECLTLGQAEVKAIQDDGTDREKSTLAVGQALQWATLNRKLSAEQIKAWAEDAKTGIEQVVSLYHDHHGVQAPWEKELTQIWALLRKLPTLRSALDDLLKKYGYTHATRLSVTASYHWRAKFDAASRSYYCNTKVSLCEPARPFPLHFWGAFHESLIDRASDFNEIEFTPAADSSHVKEQGNAAVKLTPDDVKDELKRQLDTIKSTLENKAGEMLLLLLKPALVKQAEPRRQAVGNQAPEPALDTAYMRLEHIYTVSAKLDHDSQRPGRPSEAYKWPRQSRDAQPNAMILKAHNGFEHALWVLRFNPETGAFLYLKSLRLSGDASLLDMTQYVEAHRVEFFEEVPHPEGRSGLIVTYGVHEVMVPKMQQTITGQDVLAVLALKRWLTIARFERHDRLPEAVKVMRGLLVKLGLIHESQTQQELKQAVEVLNTLYRRFEEANLFQHSTDAQWTQILSMSWEERQATLQALGVLETELKRRIPTEQIAYFHALATSTGFTQKIDRLVSDAERYIQKPGIGEFLLDRLPFVSAGRHIASIHNDYETSLIDTHILSIGGMRPAQQSGGRRIVQDQDLVVGIGLVQDVLSLLPIAIAAGHAMRVSKIMLGLIAKQATIAYFKKQGVVQIVRQIMVTPAIHTVAGWLRRAGAQTVIQVVDLISPTPFTDTLLNGVLNKMTRGLRISAKISQSVNQVLQTFDPALLNKLGDVPAIKAPYVLPDTVDVNAHFKVGVQGDWQIKADNSPALELRHGTRYVAGSEIAVATVEGQEMALKHVGTNAQGQAYFKHVDLESGEVEGGTLRLMPPVGSEASETARVEIVHYRRQDGTIEPTQTTLNWAEVSQVPDGDHKMLILKKNGNYYVVETDGDTTRLRLALEEEIAAVDLCAGAFGRSKRMTGSSSSSSSGASPCKMSRVERLSREQSDDGDSPPPLTPQPPPAPPALNARQQERARRVGIVQAWHDKPAGERSHSAFAAFAREHQMTGGTLNGYINSDGRLTLRGATLLGIDPATQFVPITRQHVLNWQNEKRVNGSEMTRTAFAREHNISGQIFTQLVNANGTPKYGWETRLEGDAVVRRPTSSIIRAVQQWLAPQNRVMGLQHFALARELHENSLRNYVDAHGVLNAQGQRWLDPRTGQLTAAGQNLIDSQIAPVTTDLIEAWRRIALEAPPRGSLEKFLAEHHLTRSSFSMYIRTDGTLTPVGEKKLARERNARPAAPPEQIAESSSASAPRPADGQNLAARYNPVDSEILQGFMELPASQQGIAGWQRHASRNALQPDDWSQSMMPDGVLRPSGWETFAQSRTRPDTALPDTSRVRLEIDNNALLFPDIDDASINRFEHYVWDIDELQVTDWGILEDSLRSLPANQAAAIKTRLELDFSEWLQSEKDDALADRNYENRFNALMTLDWAGNAPFIKAAKKLPQPFVVLGPYRGELRLSDTTLENTFTQNARRHVLSHLFAIRSGRPVSELSIRGNVISLINTNQLPGGDSLSGPDKFASPNVAVVRVEDTVYFYVTTRPIEKGEELLVDYESVDKRTSDAVAPASSQAEERRGAPIPREDAIANIGEANAALVDAPMSLQDTIASIRRLNSWRSIDADLVPALAGDLLYNTMGQGVAIRLQGETALNPMRIVPYDSVNPLVMELRDLGTPTAHYSGTYRAADGRLQTWNTPGGGDCFYYALYGTLYNRDPNLAPRTAIQDLRNRIADTLEQNYWRYYAFLNTEGNPRQNPGN